MKAHETDGFKKLGGLIHDVVKADAIAMTDSILAEQSAARKEGRLCQRQSVIADFKSRSNSNLPAAKVDELFQFICELFNQVQPPINLRFESETREAN